MKPHSIRPWRRLALAVTVLCGTAPGATLDTPAGPHAVSIGVNDSFDPKLVRKAHLGWMRLDIVWNDINKGPGDFRFKRTDEMIGEAASRNLRILAHLSHVPDYLGGGPHHNVPPLELDEWTDFVTRAARRYRYLVAAYEIWNEPDLFDPGTDGVGWKRDINQFPTWIDFAHAAAVVIRREAPGTLIVGPAMAGRNTADHQSFRKQAIYQQIESTTYPEGPGPAFVDVVSVHNTADGDQGPGEMADLLLAENLGYLEHYGPSLRNKPIWITEFGWKTNTVGLDGQWQNVCRYLRLLTGSWNAARTQLDQWDIRLAFIYFLYDRSPSSSYAIFQPDQTPNPVVKRYLNRLPFPATQNIVLDGDRTPPACE